MGVFDQTLKDRGNWDGRTTVVYRTVAAGRCRMDMDAVHGNDCGRNERRGQPRWRVAGARQLVPEGQQATGCKWREMKSSRSRRGPR
jgi:hypothetical protein